MSWQSFILLFLGTQFGLTDFLTSADLSRCCSTCISICRLGRAAQYLLRITGIQLRTSGNFFECISVGPFLVLNKFLRVTERSNLCSLSSRIENLAVICDTRCSKVSRSLFVGLLAITSYLKQVQQLTLAWTCKHTLNQLYVPGRTSYSLTSN